MLRAVYGRVASRGMASLQELYETVVQFLEGASCGDADSSDPIVLAATRSLGRCVWPEMQFSGTASMVVMMTGSPMMCLIVRVPA